MVEDSQVESSSAIEEVTPETLKKLTLLHFPTEELALSMFKYLRAHCHYNLSPPSPSRTFRIDDQVSVPSFCLCFEKMGIPFGEFLDQNNHHRLYDYHDYSFKEETSGLTRSRGGGKKNRKGNRAMREVLDTVRVPFRISSLFKNILRQLVDLVLHLREAPFSFKLGMDNIFIVDGGDDFVRVLLCPVQVPEREGSGRQKEQWKKLAVFIHEIVGRCGDEKKNRIYDELSPLMDSLENPDGVDMTKLVEKTPFWSGLDKMNFICHLASTLENDRRCSIYTSDTSDVFDKDWKSIIVGYKDLELLKKQDKVDREKLGLDPEIHFPHHDVNEERMRSCIVFMRNTFYHIRTILNELRLQKMWEIDGLKLKSDLELQALYEYVFPLHVRLLAPRASYLGVKLPPYDDSRA